MTFLAAFYLILAIVTGHWWLAILAAVCAGCALAETRRLDRLEAERVHPAGKGR